MNRRTLIGLLVLGFVGCRDRERDKKAPAELEPIVFRADTPNLLLTWIDAAGTTHAEPSLTDIPEQHRDLVRVLLSDDPRGNSDPIYVADMRVAEEDGSYTARSFARSAWEDEISRRRREVSPEQQASLEEKSRQRRPKPEAGRAAPSGTPAPTAEKSAAPAPYGTLVAIVYGADWCGPCKKAKEHLKRRGVQVDYRNIDNDPAARTEMRQKLGPRGGASIPVIDVAGRILVGFSARDLDRAIDQARKGTAL
jgi:glutaredoxin 3